MYSFTDCYTFFGNNFKGRKMIREKEKHSLIIKNVYNKFVFQSLGQFFCFIENLNSHSTYKYILSHFCFILGK